MLVVTSLDELTDVNNSNNEWIIYLTVAVLLFEMADELLGYTGEYSSDEDGPAELLNNAVAISAYVLDASLHQHTYNRHITANIINRFCRA